jgi:hypothetical protein
MLLRIAISQPGIRAPARGSSGRDRHRGCPNTSIFAACETVKPSVFIAFAQFGLHFRLLARTPPGLEPA